MITTVGKTRKSTVVVAKEGKIIFGEAARKFLVGTSQTGTVKKVSTEDMMRIKFGNISMDTQKPITVGTKGAFIIGTSKTEGVLKTVDLGRFKRTETLGDCISKDRVGPCDQ